MLILWLSFFLWSTELVLNIHTYLTCQWHFLTASFESHLHSEICTLFIVLLLPGVFVKLWPQSWFGEFHKMGKALAKLFGKKDMRILMLGLDAAGKTSILLLLLLQLCVCCYHSVWEGERERKSGKGRERKKEREGERESEGEEAGNEQMRERANIPVGMLITLDSCSKQITPASYTLGMCKPAHRTRWINIKHSYAQQHTCSYLNSILAYVFVCDQACRLYGHIIKERGRVVLCCLC